MPNDNVIKLIQPGSFDDPLTEVLRNGARALLAQAVEAEVAEFLAKHADLKTEDGLRRVVRHGHLPEREVMTGIGPVAVRQPRVRDREALPTIPSASASRPRSCRPTPGAPEPGGADPDPLPEGHLDRRLRGGAGGLARQGCARLVGLDDRAAEGGLDRRAQALERSAICRPSATSTCGPTASTCRRVWRTTSNASSSSSAQRRRAKRS